jgi:O-antigen/teichoic acid export membrane protein
VTLVTVPLYIHSIGVERYGVLATAWLLLGYFGAFDLGLGRALAYRVAFLGDGDPHGQSRSLWSAGSSVILVGAIGGLLLYFGGSWYFSGAFNTTAMLQRETLISLPVLAIALPFSLLANLLNGALNGQHRFAETSLVTTISSVATQILPLITAIVIGPSLLIVITTSFLITVLRAIYLAVRCGITIGRGRAPEITRDEIRELLQFGGWVSLAGLVLPALQISDRLIVGWLIDARAVSNYTVPTQIAQRSNILSLAVGSALFPRLAAMSGKADARGEASKITKQATRVSAALMTPLILFGIIAMQPFLNIWLSGKLEAVAGIVGQMALLSQWFASLSVTNLSLLQASGKPRTSAMIALGEVPPFFALLIFMTYHYGLLGAALASLIRYAVDYALLTRYAHGSWRDCMDYLVPGLLLCTTLIAWNLLYETMLGGVIVTVMFIACCAWSWLALPDRIRGSLMSRVFGRFQPRRC